MNTMKCQVVMLPTQSKSRLQVQRYQMSEPILFLAKQENAPYGTIMPQHLYLTSDREIQAGDWFIRGNGRHGVRLCFRVEGDSIWEEGNEFDLYDCKKIEATTDPSLKLLLIPQSFVEAYVQQQGKIEDVLVELTMGDYGDKTGLRYWLKTRPDGTCIIHRLKDSWTREEVLSVLKAAMIAIDEGYEIDMYEGEDENGARKYNELEEWFNNHY